MWLYCRDIKNALKICYSKDFHLRIKSCKNPYYKKDTSLKIVSVLENNLTKNLILKKICRFKIINYRKKIYIIAEAGVNHNGDKKTAFKLIDQGIAAGANAVKFQIFKAENLVTKSALKAKYQIKKQN